jgi:hypothetical protein
MSTAKRYAKQHTFSHYIVMLGLVFISVMVQAKAWAIHSLRLIGQYEIPADLVINDTLVGGLSGLDYDKKRKDWVMVSDDKAQTGPVRFYRVQLLYDLQKVYRFSVDKVVPLKDMEQRYYQDNTQLVPDAEAIRVDPQDGSIWWVGEGYIAPGKYPKKVKDPAIFHAGADGHYIATLPTLTHLSASATDRLGPRHNKGLEGLSFSADGQTLWAAVEGPLFQDSPKLAFPPHYSRITHFNRQGEVLAQYAYQLDPTPTQFLHKPGKVAEGISDILALDRDRLIVIERVSVENNGTVIKLYETTTKNASHIHLTPTFQATDFSPLQKRLLLTLDNTMYPKIGNIEGISWGHVLENGHASLILVSDNNFSATQPTQVFVFEVIP